MFLNFSKLGGVGRHEGNVARGGEGEVRRHRQEDDGKSQRLMGGNCKGSHDHIENRDIIDVQG